MRILHVVHNYPPEFRGGVERYVEGTVKDLSVLGHDVSVAAGSEARSDRARLVHEEWQGTRVLRLVGREGVPRAPFDLSCPELVPLVEEVLSVVCPEVVHVHHWWNLGNDLVRRAVLRGFPVVVTLHDFFSSCSLFFRLPDANTPCDERQGAMACGPCAGPKHGIDATIVGGLVELRRESFDAELRAAARVLVPSRAHGLALRQHHAGVPLLELPFGTRAGRSVRPHVRRGPLEILHFGNLSRLKGVEVLVRAVERADPSGELMRLSLAGPLIDSDVDLGRAKMHGAYDASMLEALAREADVAVFPSLARESYGLVVDEALYLGLPVVVSDRGALGERVGSRGLSVKAGDVESLASVLLRLARHPEDLEVLLGGDVKRAPTPEDHAKALVDIYAEAKAAPRASVDLETHWRERVAWFQALLAGFVARKTPPKEQE